MIITKVLKRFSKPVSAKLSNFSSLITRAVSTQSVVVRNLDGDYKGITCIGFNRPEAKNALGVAVIDSMVQTFESLKYDPNARVLILHSLVKGAFCVGADLKERAQMTDAQVKMFLNNIGRTITDLHDLPVPTIAAIDGFALGGGLEISLACDMRVASSSAKMGLVETKLAIIPGGGGTQRLARVIGPAKAKELIFTGRVIDGDEAFKIGLLNHVVDQNEDGNSAYLRALEIAQEILGSGPIAVRLAKMAINRGLDVDLKTGLAFEHAYYAQTIGTKDRLEGLKAFKEKRLPKYTAE